MSITTNIQILTTKCELCSTGTNLQRCSGCNVVHYCSRADQIEDRPRHKAVCKEIISASKHLSQAETNLRAEPPDMFLPPDVFNSGVGFFWGIAATRPYMSARFNLIEAILQIKTPTAVETALTHLQAIHRLDRSDSMGMRDLTPCQLLRIDRDQEAYDFLKWWASKGGQYDWKDLSLPYLDTKNANVLESVAWFMGRYPQLGALIPLTLLKIRLLQDLNNWNNSTILSRVVPAEILKMIQVHLVRELVLKNKTIRHMDDVITLIENLNAQVRKLFEVVKRECPSFWAGLLDPGLDIHVRPTVCSHGSREHVKLLLKYNYDSWAETPGAFDIIQALVKAR